MAYGVQPLALLAFPLLFIELIVAIIVASMLAKRARTGRALASGLPGRPAASGRCRARRPR